MKLKKNIAISESGFVFDPSSGDSFSLNTVGKEILELLNQNMSPEDIRKTMQEKYDVDDLSFEKYYYDFINTLKHYNLVENEK